MDGGVLFQGTRCRLEVGGLLGGPRGGGGGFMGGVV